MKRSESLADFLAMLRSGFAGPLREDEVRSKAIEFAKINKISLTADMLDLLHDTGSVPNTTKSPATESEPKLENSPSGLPLIPGSLQWLQSLSDDARIDLHRQWIRNLSTGLRFRYFISQSEQKMDPSNVEYQMVDPKGSLTAIVKPNPLYGGNGRTSKVLLVLKPMGSTVECNCRNPQSCVHQRFVVSRVWQDLNDQQSALAKTLLGADRPDYSIRKALSLLSKLKSDTRVHGEINPEEELSTEPETRHVWNFEYDNKQIVVTILKQQESRKGGWTKGKEVRLSSFCATPESELTPLELKMLRLIEETGYNRIDPRDAMRLLEKTDLALVDFKPCTIRLHKLEVQIEPVAAGNGFCVTSNLNHLNNNRHSKNSGDPTQVVAAVGTDHALLMDRLHSEIHAFDFDERASEFVRHILTQPVTFPTSRSEEVLKSISGIQHLVPIVLPATLGAQEVVRPVESVLLLTMKRSGILEAKMCIRTDQGKLFRPGEGTLRRLETIDGKLTQFVRNADEEFRCLSELRDHLQLTRFHESEPWTWILESTDAVTTLLAESATLVSEGRLKVLWHKHSAGQFEVLGRVSAKNVQVRVNRQRDWFGVQGNCQVGDQTIPLQTLLAGIYGQRRSGLVEVTPGKWIAIAEELRQTLQRLADVSFETRGKLQLDSSAAMAVAALEAQEIQVESDREWKKCLERMKSANDIQPEPSKHLNCSLRDYQLTGFQWLCRLSEWGIGGILADDMGLGKTIQALAVLLYRIESGPALVIAPTSLGFNWKSECERFAPSLTPILFRDSDRGELLESATKGQLIICSYGLALREAERLKNVSWGTIIFDEAQNIKNSNSKTAQQVKLFPAGWKIALTGTPMENHLGELWSIFHVVAPGVLGPWEQFRKRFAQHIEKGSDPERQAALSRVIAPFILRRNKEDVLKDLPELSESNLIVDLSPEERQRYDAMRLAAVTEIDSLTEGDAELSHDARFRVLQILTRLRQMACHIRMVDPGWTGSSSKLDVLMERLIQLKERGHRVLVFSQFTSHLELIRNACKENGFAFQYLDGQTPPAQRQKRVEEFQAGVGNVFLISLKAGGSGLNLTAADYVIHMDPWWNPAVEDQATDRAHRLGQRRTVHGHKLVCGGTVEEGIDALIRGKRDLAERVIRSGEQALSQLSTEELRQLIQLRDRQGKR